MLTEMNEKDIMRLVADYDEMYAAMASSRDTSQMMMFGEAEKKMFHKLAKHHPELAEGWLTSLKAGKWNNYLSQTEAMQIAASLVNQNGSKGPHWDYDTFCNAVQALGGKLEDAPYYNSYALWVTANMRYSDNAVSASEFVPRDQMPKYFYNVAVETLKDIDRPRYIRERFDL